MGGMQCDSMETDTGFGMAAVEFGRGEPWGCAESRVDGVLVVFIFLVVLPVFGFLLYILVELALRLRFEGQVMCFCCYSRKDGGSCPCRRKLVSF